MGFKKKMFRATLVVAVTAGVAGVLGTLAGATMLAKVQQYSVSVSRPPATPGGFATSPAVVHQSPEYTSTPAMAATVNNLRCKIQLQNTGVRVDAYWRPIGGGAWTYYGAQTSQLYSTGIIAQFNPFYLPSGPHQIKFVASGYQDRIVSLDVPY